MNASQVAQTLENIAMENCGAGAIQRENAEFCYTEGERCMDKDMHEAAARWFLKSLAYSCGVFHGAYKRAKEIAAQVA